MSPKGKRMSFTSILTMMMHKDIIKMLSDNLLDVHFSVAEHFIDLRRLCFRSSQLRAQSQFKAQNVQGAKALHQAGVQFLAGSGKNLPASNSIMGSWKFHSSCSMMIETGVYTEIF